MSDYLLTEGVSGFITRGTTEVCRKRSERLSGARPEEGLPQVWGRGAAAWGRMQVPPLQLAGCVWIVQLNGTLKLVFRAVSAGTRGDGCVGCTQDGFPRQADDDWTQEWVLRLERLLLLTTAENACERSWRPDGEHARRRRGLLKRIDVWEQYGFK